MKASEVMSIFSKYAAGPVEDDLKYMWLQHIEDIIYKEIVQTHLPEFERPQPLSEGDRELTAADPYSILYIHYLNMQNDLYIRDHQSYANSSVAFAVSFADYADWYNRTYTPISAAEDISI